MKVAIKITLVLIVIVGACVILTTMIISRLQLGDEETVPELICKPASDIQTRCGFACAVFMMDNDDFPSARLWLIYTSLFCLTSEHKLAQIAPSYYQRLSIGNYLCP